jgi:glycine/D-amino acid oxidase-like deaminating enzyme
MADDPLPDTPPWLAAPPAHPSLAFNVRVNAAVVGGGIAGATAAYLLKRAGKTVALLERRRCGTGQTGRSTGHLTALVDTPLATLMARHGTVRARAIWDAGFSALARIRRTVRDERINCGFAWVRGCLYAPAAGDADRARQQVLQELDAARALGIEVKLADDVSGLGGPVLWFENQARFDPMRYLGVLVDRIAGDGSYVFEETPVDAADGDGPVIVRSGPYRVTADFLVIATHRPSAALLGPAADARWQAALRPSTTYAVSGLAPSGALPEGLYWEAGADSYDYLRVDRGDGHDDVVLGGLDHCTREGGPDGRALLAALERRLESSIPGVLVSHRWSGQLLAAPDGLPCLGEIMPCRFIATAFGGTGLTLGTLGGMLAADAAMGRPSAYQDLFDVGRLQPSAASPRNDVAGRERDPVIAEAETDVDTDRTAAGIA